jgi:hypothetical protein
MARFFISLLLMVAVIGCAESPESERAASDTGSIQAEGKPPEASRYQEFLSGVRERDQELGAAQKLDYEGFQRTIRDWVSQAEDQVPRPRIVQSGDFTVSTVTGLLDALTKATPG